MSEDPTEAVLDSLVDASNWRVRGGSVGSWTLGERLGTGGSSVVYAAHQQRDGFEQHGAVKLLQTGAQDDRFVARFERERRILIDLVHPNIVRLLDGGATEVGVPWYAMERIQGEPFTVWAATRPLRERLEAFIAVCFAVDFAHKRMIVHCDLKPDNVLVDPSGAPRVLDFGIARLLDQSHHTGTAQLLTPRWAAPEQVRGDTITTGTDVFALGLLLWSCLTGVSPRGETNGASVLHRALQPMPAPSKHEPSCRGDLDAIVLRATATVVSERYTSAAELARDVERHLAAEPVQARSGLLWYRTTKWMRRNRGPLLVGWVVIGLLAGWAITASRQAASIRVERDTAQRQLARAESTLELLLNLLRAANPSEARGAKLTVDEVLASALIELDVEDRDPALVGEVRLAIGRVQHAVGAMEDAADTLHHAVEELRVVHPADHPIRLSAELEHAVVEANRFAGELSYVEEAERILAVYRTQADTSATADALLMATDLRLARGDFDEASAHADEARSLVLGSDPRRAARAQALLGGIDCYQNKDPRRLEDALKETREALGTVVHPEYAEALHELAYCTADLDEETARWAEVVRLRRELFGPGWMLAVSLSNHAMALESNDPERAEALLEEAAVMARESRGQWQPRAVHILLNHAAVQADVGKTEVARRTLEEVLQHAELPPELRAKAWRHLARLHADSGELDLARQAVNRGLGLVETTHSVEAERLAELRVEFSSADPH